MGGGFYKLSAKGDSRFSGQLKITADTIYLSYEKNSRYYHIVQWKAW